MYKLTLLLVALVLVCTGKVFGQAINYNLVYQDSRDKLEAGEYRMASQGFKSLLEIDPANPKASYATYFYAVSTYYEGNLNKAKDLFLQNIKNYSEWEEQAEVYLWLSKIYFEMESPYQGLYYAELAGASPGLSEEVEELKNAYLARLDIITLKLLLEKNTEESLVASYLAQKIAAQKPEYRDHALLDSLITTYSIDSTLLGLAIPETEYRDRYKVAIMLPLFVERLWQSGVYIQKSLAVDIYEGIQLATQELDSTRIQTVVFDTKMDSAITKRILASGQLKDVDAIIGPLFPKTLDLVKDYCLENKVNFLNPVTTNSQVIKHNPYAFLLRSGGESIGRLMADYVADKLDTGAYALYYGSRGSDSLIALNYARRMEADSFYLAIKQKTDTQKAREIFDSLTSSFEVVDSVELQRMYNEGENVRFMPMRDSLRLKIDSIGHIFIASDNQAIASEVMAAITSRGDSTQIVGFGNWYSIPNASLDLLETLGVWLGMQPFENMMLQANIDLDIRYREKYRKAPSKYVYYGYHAMKFIAESLLNYGVYFQNGYNNSGQLSPLYDYRHSQDNQKLVVFTLKDGVPVQVENANQSKYRE